MISNNALYQAAYEANRLAATTLPADVKKALIECVQKETKPLPKKVLSYLCEGVEVAEKEQRPLCADVGCPRFYAKIGGKAKLDFIALERAIRHATADVTHKIGMRSNRCHPITRRNPGNNVGVRAPNIDYSFEPDKDWVELTAVHKGGAFGSDYRMLFAGDGVSGIKRFVLDVVSEFGRRGLACQPVILGVGVGGTKDQSMTIGKEAATLRLIGDHHPDPVVAKLEDELLEMVNQTTFGAMGYYGDYFAHDVHIEIAYNHSATLPVSVHHFCQAARRATVRIYSDDQLEIRNDPGWFTPYMRREGIE